MYKTTHACVRRTVKTATTKNKNTMSFCETGMLRKMKGDERVEIPNINYQCEYPCYSGQKSQTTSENICQNSYFRKYW